MIKRTLTIGLAVAALGLGACGGSDEPAASTAPQASGGTTVTVGDNSFTPAKVEVSVGEKVTFQNDGGSAHTVTAAEGADFDSGSIAPGDEFTFTPTEAGTVSYVCTFHPGMQGTIEVS